MRRRENDDTVGHGSLLWKAFRCKINPSLPTNSENV